jgi:tRNA(Ile)-lysidine synthase
VRYLVAVSGGIDSVVLLDQLVASGDHELIVAHFDHGIRDDSADDARFVEGLAAHYGLEFMSKREELGAEASEELARRHRYDFLRAAAQECQATIVTAHHADDVIETIAINLQRGTGWRGIAVMHAQDIFRPLLAVTKQEIKEYAMKKHLEWVEDSTNYSDDYLRNRLRQRIARQLSSDMKEAVLAVWRRQIALRASIEQELTSFVSQEVYSRYYMTSVDEPSAIELLRAIVVAATKQSPTRPQLTRAILAIKTARPHTTFEIGAGVQLKFGVRTFIVETL